MFLSDTKIRELLSEGILVITPKPLEGDIRPNAVRMNLDATLVKYKDQVVDPMNPTMSYS